MCGVFGQVDKCVCRAWLAIRKTWCWNGSDDSETFIVLHLNHHVLKDLIIQSVATVKLTHTHTSDTQCQMHGY